MTTCFLLSVRMAPKSTSESNPFRRALAPIEARLHALETSIGGLHPDYMARILNKTTQIEEHCHEQLERIVQVMKHQKTALAEHVSKVSEDLTVFVEDLEDRTAQAIRSMEHATQRHHADAKALRRELGALESVIDTQSAQLVRERRCCERLLHDARQLVSDLEDKVIIHQNAHTGTDAGKDIVGHTWHRDQPEDFATAQEALMRAARMAKSEEDTSTIIQRAQETAASRSPSRRPSRASSPACSVISEPDGSRGHQVMAPFPTTHATNPMPGGLCLPPVLLSVVPPPFQPSPADLQLACHPVVDESSRMPASI